MPVIFSSGDRFFGFLKTDLSVLMGLKIVMTLLSIWWENYTKYLETWYRWENQCNCWLACEMSELKTWPGCNGHRWLPTEPCVFLERYITLLAQVMPMFFVVYCLQYRNNIIKNYTFKLYSLLTLYPGFLCWLICCFSALESEYFFPHRLHSNGFSPVCKRTCLVKLSPLANTLPQYWQTRGRLPL